MLRRVPLLWLLLATVACATTLQRGVSPAIEHENNPQFTEVYRIKIENKVDGVIAVSKNEGVTWEAVGKVLYLTRRVNKEGYEAAKWVGEGRVAATAVNAIHIKTGAAEWNKTVFSVLPKEMRQKPDKYRSFFSPDSSIYTDIPAGESIFGGGFAPFVGNIVLLSQPGKPVVPLPRDYVPQENDTYYIIVDKPQDYPRQIVFENRFGGRITVTYYSGEEKIIGEVLRPVAGIGRFEGSRYSGPGRIRANHAGVIDVSTSPLGGLGAFQIVPALHGENMGYVREATQWMVIGPKDADDPSLEGMAPFFRYFIQPSYTPDYLSRFLVEVKYAGDPDWSAMPIFEINKFYFNKELPAWANSALRGVTEIRILFPVDG